MSPSIEYPASPTVVHVDVLHGVEVADPYRWLEEIDSEQTRDWIQAQNRLTFDYLAQSPARAQLVERITELWNFEKYEVPVKRGGRYFFTRNDGLQNQSVLYWLDDLAAEPRLLLDPNRLSEDGTVALTGWQVSDDGRLLAYGLSQSGSDWQDWYVREVDTGHDRTDHIQWAKFTSVSWTQDGRGFFYSRYDAPQKGTTYKGANYYHKLYYHRIGTPQAEDVRVYERPDQKEWGFDGRVSEDGRYLVIHVWRGTDPENGLFYQDLKDPDAAVVELFHDFDAGYQFVGNDGPRFYVLTNQAAPRSRLIAVDLSRPGPAEWEEIIPEGADVLQAVTLVGGRFLAAYLHDAHSRVRVYAQTGDPLHEIDLPGLGTVTGLGGRDADPETFYAYTSFATPGAVYRYDVETNRSTVFRQPALAFDPGDYVTRQVFYASKDGTRVPMFISHKAGLDIGPDTPTYLYGYGGFEIAKTPEFAVSHLVWMERGGIFAQACLRGGGEYGRAWHQAGTKLNKQNVFDDFIAAAEWLIANGYTRTAKLAIGGRSNGGLLIGACLTQRPDLFGACLPIVGVLDMLRFHQFTIGWAWTSDYGSPDDPAEFEALRAYSPYHNVQPGTAYPPTLIATGDHDDRVFPAHSYKFAAALQAAQAGPAPVLIRIETKAGHGVGKPTAKLIEEAADLWAFLVQALDVASE